MALDVKKEKRTLNYREDKKEVFVVTADRNGVIDTDKMAREIAVDTGARPAQVKMILDTLPTVWWLGSKKVTECVSASSVRSFRQCAARVPTVRTMPK